MLRKKEQNPQKLHYVQGMFVLRLLHKVADGDPHMLSRLHAKKNSRRQYLHLQNHHRQCLLAIYYTALSHHPTVLVQQGGVRGSPNPA